MESRASSVPVHHGTCNQIGNRARKPLGEIFVENQILSRLTVERVLNISKRTGRRFGEILIELGLVTGEELAKALGIQYGYSVVFDFAKYKFPVHLLNMIPAEAAAEHLVFPLKQQSNSLFIAMVDPTNSKIIQNIKVDHDYDIKIVLSTRKDVRNAINTHYLHNSIKKGEESGNHAVLIAEDDKLISTMISDVLKKNGYEIILATNGIEAFKKAICHRPSLILTDKEMPKLNGYMLFNSLQSIKETAEIPVLLMSASTNIEEESIAFDKGFFDYVSKPIKDIVLLTKIKRAILANTNRYAIE